MRKARWGFWRESFLSELSAIDPSDFIEPALQIQHNFVLIGSMNGFEKAAHTWLSRNEIFFAELDSRLAGILNTRYKDFEQCELDSETATLYGEFLTRQAKVEIVKKALRLSIQERLKLPHHLRIVLTKGFQICVPREDFDKKHLLVTMRISFQRHQAEQDFSGEDVPPPHQRH